MSHPFAGGAGTSGDPYQIENVDQLQAIDDYLTSYFVLNNDIDCADTETWNEDPENPGTYFGFKPIGSSTDRFSGQIQGNGHKITDLHINRPGETYVSMVCHTNGAKFYDIHWRDVDIKGTSLTGIIGRHRGGGLMIEDCSVTGVVEGTTQVGGLAGQGDATAVGMRRCWSSVHIKATGQAGSLLGHNWFGHGIENSYATGKVECVSGTAATFGGLVGENTSHDTVGGESHIVNCYSTGEVDAANGGGLTGVEDERSYTDDSFWDTTTSTKSESASGTGESTTDMQKLDTYSAEWDIVGVATEDDRNTDYIWNIVDDASYPFLSHEEVLAVNITILAPTAQGTAAAMISTVTAHRNIAISAPVATGEAEAMLPDITTTIDGYVWQRKVEDGDWEALAITDSTTKTIDDADVSDGITYHYRAKRVIHDDESPWSNEVSITFSVGIHVNIEAPVATGTAEALVATVTAEAVVNVQAPVATGTADALVPEVIARKTVNVLAIPPPDAQGEAKVAQVTVVKNIDVQASVATGTAEAFPAEIVAQRNIDIQAPVATATGEALTGTVSTAKKVNVLAPVATGQAEALAAQPKAVKNINVQAPIATASGEALAAQTVAQRNINVTAPVAAGQAEALPATIQAVKNVNVLAPVAEASGTALAHEVKTIRNINILAPVAEASGDALPGIVTATTVGEVDVRATVATAQGEALVAEVTAIRNIDILAPLATGQAEALPAAPVAAKNVNILAPIATGTAEALPGTITAIKDVDVNILAPVATGSAEALAAQVVARQHVDILAPVAAAIGQALVADVDTAHNVNILAPVAGAQGQALVAEIKVQRNINILAPVATGSAEALLAEVHTIAPPGAPAYIYVLALEPSFEMFFDIYVFVMPKEVDFIVLF